jgi:deoxyribonuclease V
MDPMKSLPPFVSSVREAREVQDRLRFLVRHVALSLDRVRLVGAADVTFLGRKEVVAAAIVVYDIESGSIVEERSAIRRVRFPYVPGYLTFREGPLTWESFSPYRASDALKKGSWGSMRTPGREKVTRPPSCWRGRPSGPPSGRGRA